MNLYKNYNDFNKAKSACKECRIGTYYNKVVCSDGSAHPIVMIIGEAPGSDEVEQGKPFVGKAGKLLRSTLNEFGFRRNNSIISNTIPCRPENNKFPTDDTLVKKCCNKWLFTEIEMLSPKYLLLVGAVPTKFLLNLSGITKLRGQWFSFNNIDCMPTLHPSYVLRKEYMEEGQLIKQQFRDDIRNVAIRAGFIKE